MPYKQSTIVQNPQCKCTEQFIAHPSLQVIPDAGRVDTPIVGHYHILDNNN